MNYYESDRDRYRKALEQIRALYAGQPQASNTTEVPAPLKIASEALEGKQ